jgi:hypothetical protein
LTLSIGYLLKVSRVSTVKSILGASRSISGKMYSDKSHDRASTNRFGGLVRDAAKKAAFSTRLANVKGNVKSRLGPPSPTVRFNKNSLF